MTIAATFQIEFRQFLDATGRVVGALPDFARDTTALVRFYEAMVLMRNYDAKAVALQRTGLLGTYASLLGKEAVDAGIGLAMRPEDVFLGTYRDNGVQMLRGVSLRELLLYWGGDERGSDFAVPRQDFPVSITIASQCLHAAGVAYAMQLRRQPRVALCTIGDGATSKGDFYESLNAAGTWRLPLVFFITNNQWAISVPRQMQSAAQTLAQKGIAAGVPGVGSGVSVLADPRSNALIIRAANPARLASTRLPDKPLADIAGLPMVVRVAQRAALSQASRVVVASRYRAPEEVAAAWQREPILRLRNHLSAAGVWDKAREDNLLKRCNSEVQAAAQAYLDTAAPPAAQMFDQLYATLPAAYAAQTAALLKRAEDHGTDHTG